MANQGQLPKRMITPCPLPFPSLTYLVGHNARAGRAVRQAEPCPALAKAVRRPRATPLVLAVAEVYRSRLPVGAAEPLFSLLRPAERGLLEAGLGVAALAQAVLVIDLIFVFVTGAVGGLLLGAVRSGLRAAWEVARCVRG